MRRCSQSLPLLVGSAQNHCNTPPNPYHLPKALAGFLLLRRLTHSPEILRDCLNNLVRCCLASRLNNCMPRLLQAQGTPMPWSLDEHMRRDTDLERPFLHTDARSFRSTGATVLRVLYEDRTCISDVYFGRQASFGNCDFIESLPSCHVAQRTTQLRNSGDADLASPVLACGCRPKWEQCRQRPPRQRPVMRAQASAHDTDTATHSFPPLLSLSGFVKQRIIWALHVLSHPGPQLLAWQ